MTTLFFGGFLKQDIQNPQNYENDRVIFSKGHAAPLLYSLYETAGVLTQKELMTLRKFDSRLQGHPTPEFPWADVATGSLGQGLSIAVGMALALKNFRSLLPNIYVLLGDSELAEGQNWEALEIASYYKLNTIVGILDMSRLGQQGQTMLGWNTHAYAKRVEAFGCQAIVVEDGNDLKQVYNAFMQVESLRLTSHKPILIIAKTIKGKGGSFLEDKDGWHGKTLSSKQLTKALEELGPVDLKLKGTIKKPNYAFACHPGEGRDPIYKYNSCNYSLDSRLRGNDKISSLLKKLVVSSQMKVATSKKALCTTHYSLNDSIATREAFGDALFDMGHDEKIVVLDAEMSNSTFEDKFKKRFPERFYEMFIAEQNMMSTALGMAKIGHIPFVSTFAAFLTRAFDQIRMCQYSIQTAIGGENSGKNLKQNLSQSNTLNIIGSHCGVSIGADGPSQMGLEDIAMMRAINQSTVLYPADAVSSYKLTRLMETNPGINYLRTTREKTPIIYNNDEEFHVGGLKIHYPNPNKLQITNNKLQTNHKSQNSKLQTKYKIKAIVITAGITLHEALKAQKELEKEKIYITVVDLYSIKPLDVKSLQTAIKDVKKIIVVEDHYEAGGIGEAILSITNFQSNSNNSMINENSLKTENCKITKFTHLCVRETPRSGTPQELLRFEGIDKEAIKNTVIYE